MDYTPPLGNAIAFQFSGTPYSPNGGVDISLSWAPLDVSCDASFGLSVYVAGEGSFFENVIASAGFSVGVGVSCVGDVHPYGVFSCTIPVVVSGAGIQYPIANSSIRLSSAITADATALVSGSGRLTVPFREESLCQHLPPMFLRAYVSADARHGVQGYVSTKILPLISAMGNVGRVGSGQITLRAKSEASANHGVSGAFDVDMLVRVFGSGAFIDPVIGDLFSMLRVTIQGTGGHPIPFDDRDSVVIYQPNTPSVIYVRG